MQKTYDVVIAGGGLTGLLLAAKLLQECPELRVKILEKDGLPGGRLRTTNAAKGVWGYGLNFISPELLDYWQSILQANSGGEAAIDLKSYSRHQKVGILSGAKMQELAVADYFAKKGVKALGGLAAARDWTAWMQPLLESFAAGGLKDQSFGNAWAGSKKSGAVIVLQQMAEVLGLPDVNETSINNLLHKIREFSEGRYLAQWDQALDALVAQMSAGEEAILETDCHIIGANFEDADQMWTISTRRGQFQGHSLVVSQSPWQAIAWLPKRFWPANLLQLALKAKPVSCVVLSEGVLPEGLAKLPETPSVIAIPAENVHAIISPEGDICYQTTLDFEISLQAPDVVKAVRRLKRARKKLIAAQPELTGDGEHLALLSVAWGQLHTHADKKFADKMDDRRINTQTLMFVGETYGRSANGDLNIIKSVESCVGRVTGKPLSEVNDTSDDVLEDSDEVVAETEL